MFGRRKRKRAPEAVPPPDAFPYCGQVYVFQREAERAAREAAEGESAAGEAEVQTRD